MKRAIVLSGGGSKGSYEIGVWKALRRLHIEYDIVTGTSIGALNGALMTQKTYLKALYIFLLILFVNYFFIFSYFIKYIVSYLFDFFQFYNFNIQVNCSCILNIIPYK